MVSNVWLQMIPHTGPHVNCLIRCQSKHCSSSTCCSRGDEIDEVHHNQNRHIINRKYGSKEILPAALPISIGFNVIVDEISEISPSCDMKKKPSCAPSEEKISPRLEKLSEPVIVQEGNSHTINVDVVKSASSLASTETECEDDHHRQEIISWLLMCLFYYSFHLFLNDKTGPYSINFKIHKKPSDIYICTEIFINTNFDDFQRL